MLALPSLLALTRGLFEEPHLEEGKRNPEEDLGALQEQDVPDAHSCLGGQRRAEQAAEPALGDLLQVGAGSMICILVSSAA